MGLNMAINLNVHELLVMGYSDLLIRQAQGDWETRDIKLIPYRQCVEDLSKRFKSIEFKYIPRFHNELADALATLASMLPYPGNTHIDPLEIQIRDQHGYCNTIEAEPDGEPWYRDIKQFLKTREYPEHANRDQKRTVRRLSNGFFLSGEILYKRTPDLNLLRCVDAKEAEIIMNEVHSGVCGPHMNGYVLAKKILRAGYYWLTMERDCFRFVRKCHQCQIHIGATPYLLVYGTEAVIPAEIEIPSLRIIVEAGIEDTEWVKSRLEQLNLIDEKRLAAVCFGFSTKYGLDVQEKTPSLARESGTFDLNTIRNQL
ncbi:uncharacterized protein LOC142173410 [Nicotiana tabacum]|uniref:Uncharacterized protein LOC142173410 n=1 Tax=Nicotiana tabacum TaxID=4097 RepID=A0AC58TD01_TOBAC